jgi:hypothetical protein
LTLTRALLGSSAFVMPSASAGFVVNAELIRLIKGGLPTVVRQAHHEGHGRPGTGRKVRLASAALPPGPRCWRARESRSTGRPWPSGSGMPWPSWRTLSRDLHFPALPLYSVPVLFFLMVKTLANCGPSPRSLAPRSRSNSLQISCICRRHPKIWYRGSDGLEPVPGPARLLPFDRPWRL